MTTIARFASVQCFLFLVLSLSVEEEEECNRKRNNLLFDVSVGDLYIHRKREKRRMISIERRKLGYCRRKKKKFDLLNKVQNEIQLNIESLINFFSFREHKVLPRTERK